MPHRSIAVDRTGKLVPLGAVLSIERLRGAEIALPNGQTARHDGYVQAVDTGGAIVGPSHFDHFKGPSENDHGLPTLRSSPTSMIEARIVTDPAIIRALCDEHLILPTPAP
ncbi:hypothetical protein BKE38_17530 [Pseudoroseomonas deserti]|uniref:3D domain-containing protein n=1 Tax=Teichococcus deserti TaxID=1817963 RepID=A0A1V2H034_9PROT|nr:3D domain-containing protein [Pseudoroseomonas deserti]ONG50680.1 hypothetical protein BKE38_17530 [Pseudoroseomonas deserti]